MTGEGVAAGQLADHESAPLVLVVLAQALQRGHDLVQLAPAGLGQRCRWDGIGAEEQQRLERALQLGGHALSLSAAARPWAAARRCARLGRRLGAPSPSTVISANGSSWVQVASPCL